MAVKAAVPRGFSDPDVGIGHVLDVNVVAAEFAVAAHHGALAAKQGADRAGDDAVPIQITTADNVSATRDRDRQLVGDVVDAGKEIGAGLGDIVWMLAAQSLIFPVGKGVAVAVGFV